MRRLVFFTFICSLSFQSVYSGGPPGIQPARIEDLDPSLDPVCKNAVTGKSGKCRRGFCLDMQLSVAGGTNGVFCVCTKDQFLTSSGCNNKMSRRRTKKVGRPKRQARAAPRKTRKSKKGKQTGGSDVEVLTGQLFSYPKRNLLGIYLTTSFDECINLCRSFEALKKDKSVNHCGSVVVHEHITQRFICEAISSKPVKRCKKNLAPKKSYTTAFLKPLTKSPSSCH